MISISIINFTLRFFYGCRQLCLSIFKSGSLIVKAAIYPKKWASTYRIGGKVGLHSNISDFYAQNGNFITKMTFIWLKSMILFLEKIFYEKYSALIDYFVCNMHLLWSLKIGLYCQKTSTLGWVCGAKKKKPHFPLATDLSLWSNSSKWNQTYKIVTWNFASWSVGGVWAGCVVRSHTCSFVRIVHLVDVPQFVLTTRWLGVARGGRARDPTVAVDRAAHAGI